MSLTDDFIPSWQREPSLMDRQKTGHQGPILKGRSRLEVKQDAKPLTKVTDAQFRTKVATRDKNRCRHCGRKTIVTVENVPLRREIHHLHGRLGVLRHEDRCAICTCKSCHEKLTGAVNVKFVVVGTKFLELDGQQRIDARAPIKFERVA